MSNLDSGDSAPKEGVFHHKTETVTTDHEKIFASFPAIAEKVAPMVEAWRAAELEKVKAAESGMTSRQGIVSATLTLVVVAVSLLAWAAIAHDQAAIAEKIVIGLLAFLGGIGARR